MPVVRHYDSENNRPSDSVSILIVEDQELLRIGLKCALHKMKNVHILGQASDGPSAVENALDLKPDLVLMDIGLPGFDGLEAMRRIKAVFKCRILIFTSHAEEATIREAFNSGADGYCLKGASITKLNCAISKVAGGLIWIDDLISEEMLRQVV